MKYKLTIAILTMNRSDQLIEAINSCLCSKLPINTQFLIVDNASTDNTKLVVNKIRETIPYDIVYHKEETNKGVGGGRSICFNLAEGEYIYFLDDDAIINPECSDNFFIDSIKFLDENPCIASMTTKIIDKIFGDIRNNQVSSYQHSGKPMIFFFLGGSHFLRKSSFATPLYFELKYGSEEYAPSIVAWDKGFIHVYEKNISIIHQPKVNKWIDNSDTMRDILIRGSATVYATKKILYPVLFRPLIWLGYTRRCNKYLSNYKGAKKCSDLLVKDICKKNKWKKVKIKTVLKLYNMFGLTVF